MDRVDRTRAPRLSKRLDESGNGCVMVTETELLKMGLKRFVDDNRAESDGGVDRSGPLIDVETIEQDSGLANSLRQASAARSNDPAPTRQSLNGNTPEWFLPRRRHKPSRGRVEERCAVGFPPHQVHIVRDRPGWWPPKNQETKIRSLLGNR